MGMPYSSRPSLNARKELRETSEADDPSVDDAVVDFDCRCECVPMFSAPCVSWRRLVLRCSYDLSVDDLRAAANGLQKSVCAGVQSLLVPPHRGVTVLQRVAVVTSISL